MEYSLFTFMKIWHFKQLKLFLYSFIEDAQVIELLLFLVMQCSVNYIKNVLNY